MKLLVTGGLGFIGSNFILNLLKNNENFKIVNVDAMFYGSHVENLSEIKKSEKYSFVKGNIVDYDLMNKLISDCDVVVNFAAESFVDRSISNARPFFESNVKGLFTILSIIKEKKKRLVHISTDEVFGSIQKGYALENSRFNPSSPYAATKSAAELLINSYVITYDCDCLITRCTNNYGPKQFPEKLIPKTIILASQEKNIPVYGNGKNIRDWIFVDDHCEAIKKVMLNGKSGESYNISANSEMDNLTIIQKILAIMNKSERLIEFVDDRPGHDYRYSLNSSKIRKELGWIAKTSFDDGLEQTIQWYIKNSDWWKHISKNIFAATPWKNPT